MTEPLSEDPGDEGNDQNAAEGTVSDVIRDGDLEDAPEHPEGESA